MSGLVHLVRHGEVHNPDGLIYGRLPGYQLSTAGEQMAKDTAAWLAGRDVAVVVSSPLERAVQTAAVIAAPHGLDVSIDERLVESDSAFQGRRIRRAKDLLRPDLIPLLRNPLRPSWGEPFTEVAARMLAAAAAAHGAAGEREAVCVSHQLPIWVARRAIEGRRLWHRPDRRECALASVTTIRYDDSGHPTFFGYAEPAGSVGRRTGRPPVTPRD